MSRHVEVEEVKELTPHAVARAGFRAGWGMAFSVITAALREGGAPPAVLRTLLEAQARPPEPEVQIRVASAEVQS